MSNETSKYHDETMESSKGNPAGNMGNPKMPASGGSMLNPGNMENPKIPMSGGKEVMGTATNVNNPMMPMAGSAGGSNLSDKSEVMGTQGPQGSMKAPLAGKI